MNTKIDKKILIVGAGITGSTIARILADYGYTNIYIIDKRNHIAGNCYDYIDSETGVRVNQYGAHIFHTNDPIVEQFVRRFTDWIPYKHKVVSKISETCFVPVPVNIDTVNRLFDLNIQNEDQMLQWLQQKQIQCDHPTNSREMALSRVGTELYEQLFKDYTKKQWDKYPDELDASVLQRIPVRTTFEDGYFTDRFQALPAQGYTQMVSEMLNHPSIQVQLEINYFSIRPEDYDIIFYTGPIDHYFANQGLDPLEYRSIDFITERYPTPYQNYPVVNYPKLNIPYTRTVEYCHFPNQPKSLHGTVIVHEQTTNQGEPYYPVPTQHNRELYQKYQQLSENISNVYFVGRLASYKYLNMDQAIRLAIDQVYAYIARNGC